MSARRRAPLPIRHIVLYGTLRAGYPAHARLRLRAALTYVGKCILPGSLYDLGRYPGFVPGAGSAYGELYRLADPGVLARLDAFEGYDARKPGGSAYLRVPLRVPRSRLAKTVRVPAWIYVFNGHTAGRRVVLDGLWPHGRRR